MLIDNKVDRYPNDGIDIVTPTPVKTPARQARWTS